MTRDVAKHSKHADAVFVTADIIKPGAALIDIGINQVTGADGKQTIVGDSDYGSCRDVAGWITPVPGGVRGLVTVSILMRNTVFAVERQKKQGRTTSGINITFNRYNKLPFKN